MKRILWKISGILISFLLFALVYFTIKIHHTLEARKDIELGYLEALRVIASRNYDSKEEVALKNQLEKKSTENIHIYYKREQHHLASYTLEALDRARTENIQLIGDYPTPSLDFILFKDSEQFYRFAQINDTNGYYSDFDKLIGILPPEQSSASANGQKELLDYIVMHEYSHYALLQKIQALGIKENVPEWFLEGYAEYISFIHSKAIPSHIPLDNVIPFEVLEKPDRWKHLRTAGAADIYQQSEEAIAYIVKEFGKDALLDILKKIDNTHSFEEALEQSTGLNYDELEAKL